MFNLNENFKECKTWVKKNWIKFILLISSPISFIILVFVSGFFGATAILDKSVLEALIQAEATILGFFGAIFIFALTSLERRIDERKRQIITVKISSVHQYTLINNLTNQIENIQKNVGNLVNATIFTSTLFFSSLTCSLLAFGLHGVNEDWTFTLTSFSVLNLILGFFMILSIVYDMKLNPEESSF